MEPRIEYLSAKKLVGRRMTMSYAQDTTRVLWKSFMKQRAEIKNAISEDLYSIQMYSPRFFESFDPHEEFEKWAAVEVSDFENVPNEMEPFALEGGMYAVFPYKGASSDAESVFRFIFSEWLPNSTYILDSRPHFEILGAKYINDDPASEEEIWIPIRPGDRKM